MLTILSSSSIRAILLTSLAMYSCIPLKAIKYYIIIYSTIDSPPAMIRRIFRVFVCSCAFVFVCKHAFVLKSIYITHGRVFGWIMHRVNISQNLKYEKGCRNRRNCSTAVCWLVGWLVVFYVPSTARSFTELRRT